MPQGNVAIVRRVYELLNSGGTIDELMDGIEPLLHLRVEWINPPDALELGTRTGIDGWRAALANLRAGLGEDVKVEVRELVDRGEVVFAAGEVQAGGTASGVDAAGPTWAAIWTLEDGRIRRYEWSWDPDAMRARVLGP